MTTIVPVLWQHGDPAWVRGRRVRILSFYSRGGVLVETKSGDRLLVHRRDLDLVPLPAPRRA